MQLHHGFLVGKSLDLRVNLISIGESTGDGYTFGNELIVNPVLKVTLFAKPRTLNPIPQFPNSKKAIFITGSGIRQQ